jgi:hypothetical protein
MPRRNHKDATPRNRYSQRLLRGMFNEGFEGLEVKGQEIHRRRNFKGRGVAKQIAASVYLQEVGEYPIVTSNDNPGSVECAERTIKSQEYAEIAEAVGSAATQNTLEREIAA